MHSETCCLPRPSALRLDIVRVEPVALLLLWILLLFEPSFFWKRLVSFPAIITFPPFSPSQGKSARNRKIHPISTLSVAAGSIILLYSPKMTKVNTAPIKWAQRSDSLYITIALPGKLSQFGGLPMINMWWRSWR